MTALDVLGPEHTDAIAALCTRALVDPPTADEIRATLFAPDQPSTVRGDPDVGVVAAAEIDGKATDTRCSRRPRQIWPGCRR